MKTLSAILITFIFSACAPSGQDEAAGPDPVTPAKTSVWCGETIISSSGFAFKFDLTTGELVPLKDGPRGYPPVCNGWGCRPGCAYQIENGEPGPVP